ncbi:hypothetical protein EJ08DRAFT_264515 [Tothia fuscella]|uniref:Secreted protein n=1 Tax=Tothia fuscella TaxID=1048955 RepID=A0A9P4TY42_9PEZI|nr:hypothetical protein EJ08DRAFT_264515 [Tothia fuscella]
MLGFLSSIIALVARSSPCQSRTLLAAVSPLPHAPSHLALPSSPCKLFAVCEFYYFKLPIALFCRHSIFPIINRRIRHSTLAIQSSALATSLSDLLQGL